MTYQEQKYFSFVSQSYPEDKFSVVSYNGIEGLSKLYEFDITLVSEDPEVDLKKVLQNPATLTIQTVDKEFPIHGILTKFEQLQEVDEHIFYRTVLVPRLWQTDLHHENQLFLDKTVPDIIEEILKQANFTTQDYELKLTRTYMPWEYICQYNETDFNFISRWMEREGIYYFFKQTEEFEKLIISDSSTIHQDIPGDKTISYSPPSGLLHVEKEIVLSFIFRQTMLPQKVILKDYNYRKPNLDLKGEATVDTAGRGNVYIYGEHFKTPEEGNDLAKIRKEEILCREKVFHGDCTSPALCSGYIFKLEDHYRNSNNRKYLITEVEHEGHQTGFVVSGVDKILTEQQEKQAYSNRFTAILADVQFRPERKTHKPRFYGTLNAKVDAAGDGQYAEIDDQGRYKIILPFDQSGNKDGKASRWVRMAQPYAGADYGMHFPLHKGTEVLLSFVDGDPDRPIISGSVPNPETMSPVTGGNQTKSVIRTGGGNQIAIEDSDGGQQIALSSPTASSKISIGAPNEGNIFMNTVGNMVTFVHGPLKHQNNGDTYYRHGSTYKYECDGAASITFKDNVHSTTIGTTTEDFLGTKTSTNFAVTDETFVGTKISKSLAATSETFVGVKNSQCAALSQEVFAGLKLSFAAGASVEQSAVKKLDQAPIHEINTAGAVNIICGGSSIKMTPGSIKINSPSVLVSSSGGMVRMNGNVTIGGTTAFTDNVSMDEKLKVNGKLDHPSITAD